MDIAKPPKFDKVSTDSNIVVWLRKVARVCKASTRIMKTGSCMRQLLVGDPAARWELASSVADASNNTAFYTILCRGVQQTVLYIMLSLPGLLLTN